MFQNHIKKTHLTFSDGQLSVQQQLARSSHGPRRTNVPTWKAHPLHAGGINLSQMLRSTTSASPVLSPGRWLPARTHAGTPSDSLPQPQSPGVGAAWHFYSPLLPLVSDTEMFPTYSLHLEAISLRRLITEKETPPSPSPPVEPS